MRKNEVLELLCSAINDCENVKMKQTEETLRAVLQELEEKLPNKYLCLNCGSIKEEQTFQNSLFPDKTYCSICGCEIDVYE